MDKLLQNAGAATMVILPQSALEELRADLVEVKQMIQNRNEDDVMSQWVESEEARKMLGVSPKTWQIYRDRRIIAFSQFGRKIYVKRASIEAFLESHTIKAN